jgi:hypothetical protein
MLNFKLWLEHEEHEWHQNVDIYHQGLNKSDILRPGFVTVNDKEFYKEEGKDRKVFHDSTGDLGFSLIPHQNYFDGRPRIEIAGVYNNNPEFKGMGIKAIKDAVRKGGNYLECYEGNQKFSLPIYYHKHLGALPVQYLKWDDNYAHPKWDYTTNGRPGIVSMQIPDEAFENIEEWLKKDHSMSQDQFQEKLNKLKEEAESQTESNKINPKHESHEWLHNKFHTDHHKKTPEEYHRLADGVDEFYFGIDQ